SRICNDERVDLLGAHRQYLRTQPRRCRGEIRRDLPSLLCHLLRAADARVDIARHVRVNGKLGDSLSDGVAKLERLIQIVSGARKRPFACSDLADLRYERAPFFVPDLLTRIDLGEIPFI